MGKPTTIKLQPLDCAAVWRDKEARYELSVPGDDEANVAPGALAMFAAVTRLINEPSFAKEQVEWFMREKDKH